MGQQFSSISQTNRLYQMPLSDYGLKQRINSALSLWKLKSPPFEELLQSRMVVNSHDQLSKIYQIFTMRLSHLYLPATKYLTCQQYGIRGCGEYYKGNIYFQSSIATLSVINDIPFFDSLHIYSVALKGFEILYKKFGYFDVFEDMFYICSNGRVKVWCNSHIHKLAPESYVLDIHGKQEDMLIRIINIIDENVDKTDKLNFKQILYKKVPNGTQIATFSTANMLIRQICKQNNWQPPQRLKCIAHLTREDVENLLYQQQKGRVQKNSKQNIAQIQNMLTMNTLNHQQSLSKKEGEQGNTSIRLPVSSENRIQSYNKSANAEMRGNQAQQLQKNNYQIYNYSQSPIQAVYSPRNLRDKISPHERKPNINQLIEKRVKSQQNFSKQKTIRNQQIIYHIPLRVSESLVKPNNRNEPNVIGNPVHYRVPPPFVSKNSINPYSQQKQMVPHHIIRIIPQVPNNNLPRYLDGSSQIKNQTEIFQRITIQKRQEKQQNKRGSISNSAKSQNAYQSKQKQKDSLPQYTEKSKLIKKEQLNHPYSKNFDQNGMIIGNKKSIDQFIVDGVKNSIDANSRFSQDFDQIQKPKFQENLFGRHKQSKGTKQKIQMSNGVDRVNTLPKPMISRNQYNSGRTIQEFHPFKQLTENSSTQDLSQKYSPYNESSQYTNPRFFDMLNINRSRQIKNVDYGTKKQSDMCFSFSNKNLQSSNGDIQSQRWSKKWKDYTEIRDTKKSDHRQNSLQSNRKKYQVSIDSDIWKDLLTLKKSKEGS